MQILLSVADFEQYENDKRGIVIPLKLPKKQFYALLNLLGPVWKIIRTTMCNSKTMTANTSIFVLT